MEQIEIVERYLERIRRIYQGENTLDWEDRNFHEDDVFSFFVHCNHLRDWVFKLNKIGIEKSDIDNFVRNNRPLQICSDLANRAKHCELQNKTWSGHKPHIVSTWHRSSRLFEKKGVKSKFTIMVGVEFFDALEIAEECWLLWEEFIENQKEKK